MTRWTLAALAERLVVLEARDSVQRTLNRYMELCDVPYPAFDWDEMASLFAEDAVWEGIGGAYTGKFGRVEGRPAVLAMLAGFLPPSTHFSRNVHLLGSGTIDATESAASGRWIMQQLSFYGDGGAELIAARLTIDFDITGGTALIRHFRTEKLFTSALDPAAAAALAAS